jgi:CheY-like chemotaxis protein
VALANTDGDTEVLVRSLEGIRDGTRRAAGLVDQILTFGRKSGADTEPLKLHLVIEDAVGFIRSSIPSTIAIDFHFDAECAAVLGNRIQIHQVVTNLCTNAMHAMEADGAGILKVSLERIVLSSSLETLSGKVEAGEYSELSVSDTGAGIDSASLQQVLDPFYTTKEVGKGTGLGLAMVHGIVVGSGGGLRIESEIGRGTTVRVMLPVIQGAVDFERQEKLPAAKQDGTGHIMIVDDEEMITRTTSLLLMSRGFTAEAFNDVTSALQAFRGNPNGYDLALFDYTMPGKTGIGLARDFELVNPALPVIIATGQDRSLLEDIKSQNIVEIIKKPYRTDDLVVSISRAL